MPEYLVSQRLADGRLPSLAIEGDPARSPASANPPNQARAKNHKHFTRYAPHIPRA
jgi:hypothetical protein